MMTVTKTIDGNQYQSYALPVNTTGTIEIKVVDTNQAWGTYSEDTLYIDSMFILCENEVSVNTIHWDAQGADDSWTTSENWNTGQVPGLKSRVALDVQGARTLVDAVIETKIGLLQVGEASDTVYLDYCKLNVFI